mgnify:CR=1 FL=1
MSNWLDEVKFDSNGLVPAIAQHHQTGRVLMVAWMNREALALTAEKLQQMGIVEYVVDEGEGAHLQPEKVMQDLKAVLKQALEELQPMDAQERCEARYQRLMKFGSDNLGLAS